MAGSDLVISVGASIKDLERQMKAAARVAEQAADDIEADFKRRNPSFAGDFGIGLLKGAIAAISVEKLIRGFADLTREVASFADTARRAGIEVERFQELRAAAGTKGITGGEFDKGLSGIAKALNDARSGEGDLGALLDANNIKYKDREGNVISTNEALAVAADLISRAATEQDKLEIAKKFGLPDDFVPLLENGAAALDKLAQNAREAGAVLDADMVQRAKQFDDAWSSAWSTFITSAKAATVNAAAGLADLIQQAREFQTRMDNAKAGGAALGNMISGLANGEQPSGPLVVDVKPRRNTVTAPLPPSRPGRGYLGSDATVIPSESTGGGGGSSGKSEAEGAQDRLDRYVETLMRQNSVLDAEIATFGKSNAEKRAAVELAKAQVDLNKLDEDSRKAVISSLTQEIQLSEQKRTQLKSLQDAQKGLSDAQKYFGNAAVDALEDLIVNGAKAEDVMKRLAASLVKAALQAALLGQGPLAGVFGTAGTGSNVGGLVGALFGRATGGGVNAGQPYRVGERGPETFVPTTPGRIVPAGRGGGGIVVNVQNNTPAQVETRPRSDGGFDMIIDQIDGALAQRSLHGQGALTTAFAARSTGRHLRG